MFYVPTSNHLRLAMINLTDPTAHLHEVLPSVVDMYTAASPYGQVSSRVMIETGRWYLQIMESATTYSNQKPSPDGDVECLWPNEASSDPISRQCHLDCAKVFPKISSSGTREREMLGWTLCLNRHRFDRSMWLHLCVCCGFTCKIKHMLKIFMYWDVFSRFL